MNSNSRENHTFYVAGGTVPVGSAAYVNRQADDELLGSLLRGEFCYVLTSRQMGKSSLMARTAQRLRANGVQALVVDLTSIGHDLDREQWYYSLLVSIAEPLGMRQELRRFWDEHSDLTPLQRWIEALRHVLLQRTDERLVLFIDEIDTVLALPFKAGEFFAAIRACHNRRSEDTEFERLTFCLLGVANPSDLIADTRLTPFNIGRRIELNDFTLAEAEDLEPGLGGDEIMRRAIVERVVYWTGGHPYLTQRLCQAVAECGEPASRALVDKLCGILFLSPRSREQDDNLYFVRDRLLCNEIVKESDEALAEILGLYRTVCSYRPVPDNMANRLVTILRLSGIVRSTGSYLRVRNRIYATVFDQAWIREHMPGAELRRQRAAYRRVVARTVLVSSGLFTPAMIFAILAFLNYRHAGREAARANGEAEYSRQLLYASDMSGVSHAFEDGQYGRVAELLDAHKPRVEETDRRGFEWRYYDRLMHQDLRTLVHSGRGVIQSIAISPDGSTIASGRSDGTIRIWNVSTGAEVVLLRGPITEILSLAFNPNKARFLAATGKDGCVRLWDTQSRRVAHTFTEPVGEVYSVAFSPDGHYMASGGQPGEICLWDAHTARLIKKARNGTVNSQGIAFSADSSLLATNCGGGTVVYGVPNLVPAWTAGKVTGYLDADVSESIAFSPTANVIAIGKADGRVEVWRVGATSKAATLYGHNEMVGSLCFSGDGTRLASASWDNTLILWDMAKRRAIHKFVGHTKRVTSVALSRDGSMLASGGGDDVKLWDTRLWEENPGRVPSPPIGFRRYSYGSLEFSRRGSIGQYAVLRGVGAGALGWLARFDETSRRPVFERRMAEPTNATLSPDRGTVVVGTGSGELVFFSSKDWREQNRLRVDQSRTRRNIGQIAFSPDGKYIAASSGDPAIINVWNITTRKQIAEFKADNGAGGISFSPDGTTLAIARWQGSIILWKFKENPRASLSTSRDVQWTAHANALYDVAFSPDGKTLASASRDGTVKLWNVETRREMATLRGGGKGFYHVAFSPDGSVLAASTEDGEVTTWRAGPEDGAEKGKGPHHPLR